MRIQAAMRGWTSRRHLAPQEQAELVFLGMQPGVRNSQLYSQFTSLLERLNKSVKFISAYMLADGSVGRARRCISSVPAYAAQPVSLRVAWCIGRCVAQSLRPFALLGACVPGC